MAKKASIIFKAINFSGAALLGEGAGTLEAGTVGAGEANAEGEDDGAGEAATTLSTLISTFCPA